ncbi:hypothetical protein ACOMHN_002977 [Nucella lapillus]
MDGPSLCRLLERLVPEMESWEERRHVPLFSAPWTTTRNLQSDPSGKTTLPDGAVGLVAPPVLEHGISNLARQEPQLCMMESDRP